MNNKFKKILIIHTDGNTFNNPSLKCIIDLLIREGYKIDLRYPKSYAPMPKYDGVTFFPYGIILKKLKSKVFDKWLISAFIYIFVWLEKIIYYSKYDFIIGVDRQGLIEASILNKITNTPYIFISFEIMFESETSKEYKSLEKKASKNVSAWIVQDEIRAEKLQIENNLESSNKILLPLASARIGSISTKRLRDDLGIPIDKKVAIVIGSMSEWTMSEQILKSVSEWPNDWTLIVHERYGRTLKTLDNNIELINKKIFISETATDLVDDMSYILSGIEAGLAFYKPDFKTAYTGKNLVYLGLASGKISTYLRYGVPVITNEIGTYAEEIIKYDLGRVVKSPDKIKYILENFMHEKHSQNSKIYFLDKLDFYLHSEKFLINLSHKIPNTLE